MTISKEKKSKNLHKSSKNLGDFINKFIEKFPKSYLDHFAWDFFFNKKNGEFCHKKSHGA